VARPVRRTVARLREASLTKWFWGVLPSQREHGRIGRDAM